MSGQRGEATAKPAGDGGDIAQRAEWLRSKSLPDRVELTGPRKATGAGGADVGVWDRLMGRRRTGTTRAASAADIYYLQQWAATRTGVEAFVEPRTTVTETTMVLVAHDGEWTRRRVDGDHGARQLGQRLRIPVYDVAVIGYPQRMRDYTARQRILREREEPKH